MSILDRVGAAVRRKIHQREIEERLSTVVPEDRQHYLRASLARWNIEP